MKTRSILYSALVAFALGFPVAGMAGTGWLQTDAGTYDFNDPDNWDNGVINGIFGAALAGNQTITFGVDTALPALTRALNFTYTTGYGITFQSDDAEEVRTLTVSRDSSYFFDSVAHGVSGDPVRTITFADNLIIDINDVGEEKTDLGFFTENRTTVQIDARITGTGRDHLDIRSGTSASIQDIIFTNANNDFTAHITTGGSSVLSSSGYVRALEFSSLANKGQASALGAGDKIILDSASSYTQLRYVGTGSSTDREMVMNSTSGNMEIFHEGSGTLLFEGDFTRTTTTSGTLRFRPDTGRRIEVTGTIEDSSGSGSLTLEKYDSGTLYLSGENEFSGGIFIRQGTIEFTSVANSGTNSSLGSDGTFILGDAGRTGTLRYLGTAASSTNRTLELAGSTGSISIINDGTGTLQFTNTAAIEVVAGSKTLTLGGNNTGDNLLAGVLGDGSTGSVSLTKNGTGTWILSGANTYSGATSIEEGLLRINGSTGAGAVTVEDGGTLGGTGTIGGAITLESGGAVAPGNSIGTLSGSSLTWNSDDETAGMVFELGSNGSTSDRLVLSGAFAKGSGETFLFDFQNTGVFGSYTLVEFDSTDFILTDFEATNLAEGLSGSFDWDGDSLVLEVIPEPHTMGLILLGLGAVALRRRLNK